MKLIRAFIDLIYPPKCHVCGDFLQANGLGGASVFFCKECYQTFDPVKAPFCPICGVPCGSDPSENHLCEDCLRTRPEYERLFALYQYKGAVLDTIHGLKYGGKTHLSKSMGPLLAVFARHCIPETKALLTMPVPIHPRRLRERGFNQSLLLARYVANELDTALDFLSLARIKYTPPQTGLDKNERQKNVRGAFQVISPGEIRDRSVLLVDDVATTGNTLNECARVLLKSGCHQVLCLVLARA